LAAEGGFPALFLYLTILYLTFRNLKRVRTLTAYRENPEIRAFSGALWASLLAFAIGSFFASFEYELFPYFMVAYTSVLYRLTVQNSEAKIAADVGSRGEPRQLLGPREAWKR
jgi:hypothetical protein